MKNPYRTLGISPGASTDEIRVAYRSLAFGCHPDTNPGDPSAERRFREIQRAYELLSGAVDREPKASVYDTEVDRLLERLRASLDSGAGSRKFGFSLGKSCLRKKTTHHERPFSPTSGFVRPLPPLPPKAPRSPVSPVSL